MTFKLLEGQTDQETFDTVISKLATQGKPAFDKGRDACRYLQDNCKCAIGHLFPQDAPDDAYLFLGGVNDLYNRSIIEKPRNLDLLVDLQQAHDLPIFNDIVFHMTNEAWRQDCAHSAIQVAGQYGLNPAEAEAWLDRQPVE